MSVKLLIVDGYNVIHRLDKYKNLREKDISLAVNSLIADLAALMDTTGWRISAVFDGRESTVEEIGGVDIVYTAKGKTADAIIERLSYAVAEGEVLVATADYQQQKAVFRSGVGRLTPRELGELFKESRRELDTLAPQAKRSFLEDNLPDDIRRRLDRLRKSKE